MRAWVDSFLNFWKKIVFWGDIIAIVRLNGIIVLAVAAGCVLFLSKANADLPAFFDPESFFETFALLLLAVFSFYLVAVIAPYIWFFFRYYLLRKDRNQILFKFPKETCVFGDEFTVDAILQRKMRLLFGVIKFRLVFFNYDTTDWYFLLRSQKRRGVLFQSADRGAVGSFGMRFRHLGRFRTRYSVVKFEDPLGLFSIPIIEKEYDLYDPQKNFYIYSVPKLPSPDALPYYVLKRNVAQSSEQNYRIAEDFFDQKRYEPTDDSRRILWKVYARTNQLLVRIPERDSSIDADVDVYILFYNSFFIRDTGTYRTLFDQYVTDIGSFLQTLMHARSINVKLHCDTNHTMPYEFDPHQSVIDNLKRGIVSNYWHRDTQPADYIHHVNAMRSPDRERIIIINPYIRPELFPTGEFSQFTTVRLLGTERLPERSEAERRNIFIKPERLERNAVKALLSGRIRRTIERNRNALVSVIPEGGNRGGY